MVTGGTRDPVFGPVVAFGPGGTLVELLGSTAFRAAPISVLEAGELLDEQPVGRLIGGFRGRPPVDRDTLARFLVGVSELLATHPEIVELDLNPVVAAGRHIVAVDVGVVVAETYEERTQAWVSA